MAKPTTPDRNSRAKKGTPSWPIPVIPMVSITLGARFFSAAQGRFTTPDWSAKPQPVPYARLEDPETLNLYSYRTEQSAVPHRP